MVFGVAGMRVHSTEAKSDEKSETMTDAAHPDQSALACRRLLLRCADGVQCVVVWCCDAGLMCCRSVFMHSLRMRSISRQWRVEPLWLVLECAGCAVVVASS